MRASLRKLILVAASLLLIGCDEQGRPIEEPGLNKLGKGVSSEADVRMVMGKPETVWEEDDGTRTLEYPKGPEGARTWMFIIDRDGKLQDYQQVLTSQNFARIQPGLSRDEVRRILGKPGSVVQFKRKNEEVWDWRFLDGVDTKMFNVHFDMSTGKVTQTSISEQHLPG
ncbi:Beta-barrel assembly machine subunit BamE [Paucimonas lemoignei]|uniref:Beta-barrel assembly machine subunit BamE n=1 Tax=Paucimonas lemoignei TaxID=29443 RepID=A0A4R3HUP6_PAULE|nr:outer membrane protein assembly factor BamE [Paucimonas lemoignei]TCS36956.1 Beta-barrel assembly machine subunit BamE [Paucimonas lemoignei]